MVKKVESKEKTISREEFFELELRHAESDKIGYEKTIFSLEKELSEAKKSLLSYMSKDLDRKIIDLKTKIEGLQISEAREKKARDLTINKIKKRQKITGRFGYDPDTLIIIEG